MERKMEEAVPTKTLMQPTGNKRLLWWQQVSLWLGDKARRVQWKNPHGRMSHRSLLSTSWWAACEVRDVGRRHVWLITSSTRVDGENICLAKKWRCPRKLHFVWRGATLEAKGHLLLFYSELVALPGYCKYIDFVSSKALSSTKYVSDCFSYCI